MAALRDPNRESQRWLDAALATAESLHGKAQCIHVMDREGDQFELMSMLVEHEQHFLIRIAHDRRLEPGRGRSGNPMLFESLATCPYFFTREVVVGARATPAGSNKIDVFPARARRVARLEVRAGSREIFASHMAPAHVPRSLTLQVVEIREVDPPKGAAPIIWRLVTTEAANTRRKSLLSSMPNRQRWLIEEFFKAVKTGCRYQQLQLESLRALLIALSIECAVAWRLLLMRWSARHHPDADAESVMPSEYLRVLREIASDETGQSADAILDAHSALLEVARLGGHIQEQRRSWLAGSPSWI
jgi:hypothetical protein